MGDIAGDPDLDHKADLRSDLEQVTGARSSRAEAIDGDGTLPLEPTGTPDGIAGAATGETREADQTAQ